MRKYTILSLAAAGAMLGVAAWKSGYVRGTVEAMFDHARNRPAAYSLGCTNAPPNEPIAFRVQELLQRECGVRFVTIGGIGPSEYQSDFVVAYDAVSYWIMQRRRGVDFLGDLERRAAGDIFIRDVDLSGRFHAASREFVTANRDFYRLKGPDSVFVSASLLDDRMVHVSGRMVDIRGSEWQKSGSPEVEVGRIVLIDD